MELCFALPPSLGTQAVRDRARQFAGVLYEAGFETVVPVRSYETLLQVLTSGDVHAAWGPPLICAQVEAVGGVVALRAVRHGSTSYRSTLVCRAHDDLDLDDLRGEMSRGLRAVWVAKNSMGGYVLPRHYLLSEGVDPAGFESEKFLGSYEACFHAVMECEADITASYVNARGVGYVEICREEAFYLRTFGYSPECPNDGVVISPRSSDLADEIRERIAILLENPEHRRILCESLEVDDLDRPAPGTYRGLLDMLRGS